MNGIPIGIFRRSNIAASLLIPILAISMLTLGMPLMTTQTITQTTPNFAKISPMLFDKITTQGSAPINVLIETYTNDYSGVVADVNSLGGKVTHGYKYINALAASIPADQIALLSNNDNIVKIYYDEERTLSSGSGTSPGRLRGAEDTDPTVGIPIPLEDEEFQPISITPEQLASLEPSTYWNPTAMGAIGVWEEGYYGQGSLAVIIDTGIWTGHFMLAGTSVIGGVDLSFDVGTDYEGWDSPTNHWHGSHVAGILAGAGGIVVPPDHPLAVAIELYTGVPLPSYGPYKVIWLLGMAPLADLYIVKVFDHTGRGIPEALVLDAFEHVIDLKIVEGVDVDLVSMSLGGPTLYDGRDIEDQLVDYMTSVGITMVAAAGNEGPALMTTSSPGSANTAITVGAAANPVNTRVFYDYYYGYPGIGYYLYTADVPQIYAFSSRGPTSDGRLKPTVAATAIYVLSAYITLGPGGLAWASGTSMSTPAVSGAVALINSYAEDYIPEASPEDYKQAIQNGAIWLDGYTAYDQGAGYLDAYGAFIALMEDESYGDVAPPLPLEAELVDITNIPIVGSGVYTASIENLPPGHKVDFNFEITEATESIRLDVTNVELGIDPLGVNSFEVYIQSAKRTYYDYYIDSANVVGNAWFLITDGATISKGHTYGAYSLSHIIEPGYMKIVIENDWTSYDKLSCDIKIKVTEIQPEEVIEPDVTFAGEIGDGEWIGWAIVPIPEGAEVAIIELWWVNDWTKYPTSDLDMYLYLPDTGYIYEGATLNSPERVDLDTDGQPWFAFLLHGYAIYTGEPEPFEVRIWFM